jgi:hypothetical protein
MKRFFELDDGYAFTDEEDKLDQDYVSATV